MKRRACAKRPYHHGDLRRTLVVAAARIIAEEGAANFTWAKAVSMVGVSIAAPYRHFQDKTELFTAVAVGVYAALRRWIAKRVCEAPTDPAKRALARVDAYIGYARKHPHLFTLLYSADVDYTPGGELANLGRKTVEEWAHDIGAATDCDSSTAEQRARDAWLILHGAATLAINGQLRMPNSDWIDIEEIRRAVALQLGLTKDR
jgi:AcrR family transcriptional regulator